ncbi:MAG: restriction endonuclease [Pyrinomonadaceae bacterium]|nr:restriction endonuclease [Pyrinomonadaceae bacterium]MDQ3134357.1 restriction endonuclease [Acidobacteriota bacterium]
MPIPDFQSLFLPMLELLSDGKPHQVQGLITALADRFKLSEVERAELLPSGKDRRFNNRVGWARTHLKKAGLIEYVQSGVYHLSERGRAVLSERPAKIDLHFLDRYEEHREFRRPKPRIESNGSSDSPPLDQTPRELLERSHETLRNSLAQELLDRVRKASPTFFEQLVVDLLIKMGYGGSRHDAGERIGRSGDGGVDGVIKEDKLGLDVIYVQAKRWQNTVGRPDVQAFAGSLEGHRAKKGVFITTSRFSDDAKEYVSRIEKRIVLLDGEQLSGLMIDHDIGVTVEDTYVIRRIDSDYFAEE